MSKSITFTPKQLIFAFHLALERHHKNETEDASGSENVPPTPNAARNAARNAAPNTNSKSIYDQPHLIASYFSLATAPMTTEVNRAFTDGGIISYLKTEADAILANLTGTDKNSMLLRNIYTIISNYEVPSSPADEGEVQPRPRSRTASQNGNGRQFGGADFIITLEDLADLTVMNIPYLTGTVHQETGQVIGAGIPVATLTLLQSYTPQSSNNQQSLNKIFTVVLDAAGNKIVIREGQNDVNGTLIDLSSEDTCLKLGITGNGNCSGLVFRCNTASDKPGCLTEIKNYMIPTATFDMTSINKVNPRLIYQLLENLKWPQRMVSKNRETVRSYAESYNDYIEYTKNNSLTDILVGTDANSIKARAFLELAAKYINTQYPQMLNQTSLIDKSKDGDESRFKSSIPYAVTGFSNYNRDIISQMNNLMIPTVVNRNNSLLGLIRSGQNALPPFTILGAGQQGGSYLKRGEFLSDTNLYEFYKNSIDRIKQAFKLAKKNLSNETEQKIDSSLQAFKDASTEFAKQHNTVARYNQLNKLVSKDSKVVDISYEDMERYNKRFGESVNALNDKEIKVVKIISRLQESMLDVFKRASQNGDLA
jgi:hypothetical protein